MLKKADYNHHHQNAICTIECLYFYLHRVTVFVVVMECHCLFEPQMLPSESRMVACFSLLQYPFFSAQFFSTVIVVQNVVKIWQSRLFTYFAFELKMAIKSILTNHLSQVEWCALNKMGMGWQVCQKKLLYFVRHARPLYKSDPVANCGPRLHFHQSAASAMKSITCTVGHSIIRAHTKTSFFEFYSTSEVGNR